MSKSIYKNAFFKGILSFCNIIIPLLVMPYVYRVLDPQIIGNIEYGNTICLYFFIFGSLGIYSYGLREISKVRNKPELVEKIYSNLFGIGLISNGIAFICFILFAFIGFESGSFRTILFLLSIGLISNSLYTEWINEAYEEFFFITIKTLIIRVLSILAIFILIKGKSDYNTYVFITVLVIFFNNLISFIYALRYTKFAFRFKDIEWRKYLPPLFFILILNNSTVFYTLLDRTMLGIYSGAEAVAYYSLGQKIMEIVRALLMTSIFVSMPRLSHYLENDYNRYISGIHNLSRLVLFIALPLTIGLILTNKEVVTVYAGKQYLPAILPAQIFSIRILVLSIESIISQQILFLHGKEKVIIFFNIVFGLLNLSLKFLFVYFGNLSPSVAIVSTTFVEILCISSEIYFVKHYLNINIQLLSKSNGMYLGCALVFIPIVIFIRFLFVSNLYVLFVSVLSCSFFYISIMMIFKEPLTMQLYQVLINKVKRK